MEQSKPQTGTKSELKGAKATLQTANHLEQVCCRICLQQMPPSETFTVCKCKGANAHVHEKCLLEWAKKTQKYRESFDTYYYHCQICKQKILLEVVTKLKCLRWRQITFCGEDFCCTFSSLTIFFMGLAMFVAGVYLKVTSETSNVEYLFDLTLSLSVVIISFDLVLSILYYILYNQIAIVGILLPQDYRRNLKHQEPMIENAHRLENGENKMNKKPNPNLNQTQVYFAEDNNLDDVRQFFDEARFQTLNRNLNENQSPPRQRILSPDNQNPQNSPENHQQNISTAQAQTPHSSQQLHPVVNQLSNSNPMQRQNQASNSNQQSLVRNQFPNIHQRDCSTSTVMEYETRSIMVRSISIKSRGDYQNHFSSYNNTPVNDESATFSNIENEFSQNQIPTPKSLMVKKPNPLNRFRKTLDESLVRSEIHLRQQKRKYYGQGEHERVSEEGQELENDMDLYIVEMSNKKLQPKNQKQTQKIQTRAYESQGNPQVGGQ